MPLSTVTSSVGSAGGGHRDDFRGQAVAEFEAIRHQEIHVGESPAAQRPQHQRRAGGAIGIKVADHEDAAAITMPQQQFDGGGHPAEGAHRQQPRQVGRELRRIANTAGAHRPAAAPGAGRRPGRCHRR